MSVIHVVRHGQASFGAADYDALSPLGPAQLAALGRAWVACGEQPTAVYTGALLRQRQSELALREVYTGAGLSLPAAQRSDAFNEYDHKPLLREHARWLRDTQAEPLDRERLASDRRYFHHFMAGALGRWVSGELLAEGLETWPGFRARCVAGIEAIRAECGRGQCVVVFTSAGAIGAIAGEVLGISDAAAIELKLGLYNASVSTLMYSASRITLSTFNCIGHLQAAGDPQLITYR